MKRIRPVAEAEVLAEFLKGEFHQKEYHADRHSYERLVMQPNLLDENENRLRRELLYRRHRYTWNELPQDVRWFQAELDLTDVKRIRVFPRGHWPKMTTGSNFGISDIAQHIRERKFDPDVANDVTAIHAITYAHRDQPDTSAVLLIGVDEDRPLTILEGNHRMIAAALISVERLTAFTIYVGLSSSMTECFWYQNTLENKLRYAWRRFVDVQPGFLRGLRQRWAE